VLYDIWRVHYNTYAEVLTMGDLPQEVVARGLTEQDARKMLDELGFGYCMKPAAFVPQG
jgi:hypothetical protein